MLPYAYIVFGGHIYYPYGGWEDFKGRFLTLNEAKDAAFKQSIDEGWNSYGWYQILQVDLVGLGAATIIESGDIEDLIKE